jgi:hypothetical protein
MKFRNIQFALMLFPITVSVANAVGLINGDFELPVIPSYPGIVDYTTGNPPPAAFGWQLASGAIDLTAGTYWQPASGQQSLDMCGDWGSDPGVIYQDLTFSHAGEWAIMFCMSANPDSPYPDFPTDRSIRVDFGTPGGSMNILGTWTLSANGRSRDNMDWVTFTTPIFAVQDSVIYRLQFASLTPAPYGPVLDNVQLVSVVPEPSAVALIGIGALAILFWLNNPFKET